MRAVLPVPSEIAHGESRQITAVRDVALSVEYFRERTEIGPGTGLFGNVLNFRQRRFGLLIRGLGRQRNQYVAGTALLGDDVSSRLFGIGLFEILFRRLVARIQVAGGESQVLDADLFGYLEQLSMERIVLFDLLAADGPWASRRLCLSRRKRFPLL
jgi:hypothetical protein